MSEELRERLELIVMDLDAHPLESHASRIAELVQAHPHSIAQQKSDHSIESYNCVIHALGLRGKMAEFQYPLLFAGTALVNHLIGQELEQCDPRPDAVVAWSSEGVLRHVGKLIATDRVESKWGLGHLWAHGLDELPLRYGDVTGFYAPIEPEVILVELRKIVASL